MPEPKFLGNSSVWKQQRGSTFGTLEDGTDYIELQFRGKSELALSFKQQYLKGTACPEPGFSHCRLVTPPSFSEDDIGFTRAILRFEGASPLEGTFEGTNAQIEHKTIESDLEIYTKVNQQSDENSVYRYFRNVVIARYIKETKPTGNTRYTSALNDDPDPKPVANVKLIPALSPDFSDLVKGIHYDINETSAILHWTETTEGVFEIVEEHVRFLYGKQIIIDTE